MKRNYIILLLLFTANASIAQCLVANYSFSGDANDYSGNGYDATVNGATLTTDRFGNSNSAYEFDGTNDYIDTQTSFDFEERTVSMWAMVYDTTSPRRVLEQDASSLNYGSFAAVFKDGYLYTNAGGEGGNIVYTAPDLNAWYHIVLVRNATQTKVYVNSNLVHTGTPSGNGSSIDPNIEMVIGTNRSKNGNFFSGKIDDILVYNCELSQTEIDSLYNDYDIFSSTQEFSDINLSIYPNPMNDYAIIKFDRSPESPYSYVLFDQRGRTVKSASGISDNQIRIEKNNLANGVYFFQLKSKGEILGNYKLIIE